MYYEIFFTANNKMLTYAGLNTLLEKKKLKCYTHDHLSLVTYPIDTDTCAIHI